MNCNPYPAIMLMDGGFFFRMEMLPPSNLMCLDSQVSLNSPRHNIPATGYMGTAEARALAKFTGLPVLDMSNTGDRA